MSDANTITVRARETYGVVRYYPVCDKARWFAELANSKTLTTHALALIQKLGYTVTVAQYAQPFGPVATIAPIATKEH